MSLRVEDRRGRSGERVKAQEKMLGAHDLHGTALQQRQAKGIGAGVFFTPVRAGNQA